MESNSLLDALLDEAGLSHAGLAARVNAAGRRHGETFRYDHTAVGRWLKGQRPRGIAADLVCDVLSERLQRPVRLEDAGMHPAGTLPATLHIGGFVERATAQWRSAHGPSGATRVISGLAAIQPVWEWENPPEETDVSRTGTTRVSTHDVDMLHAARVRYERMYRSAGGVATRGRLRAFLVEHTSPLLRGSYSDTLGRDLCRAVGGIVAIAGICAYDSDEQGAAQRHFHQALRLAKASGDRAFGGYVVALLANQSVLLKHYRQAVAFAEAGVRTAGGSISPALATDLNTIQAQAFAHMGDGGSAHAAMVRAETAASRIGSQKEPAETDYVQPVLLHVQLAETLISLRDWTAARAYAEEAFREQTHARGRVQRLATLTTVDLGHGDVDRAVTHARAALDESAGMESRRLQDRFLALRERMACVPTPATRDLVEEIDVSLSVPL